MASIKLRGGTYYAVWYNNGKNIVRTTGIKAKGAKEKKLAQSTADAMEAVEKKGVSVMSAMKAIRTAADISGLSESMPSIAEYFKNFKAYGSPSNIKNTKRAFTVFVEFLGADSMRRLDTLNVSMCKDFIRSQFERVAYGTVERYKTSIHMALEQAVEECLLDRNPMNSASVPKLAPVGIKKKTKRLPFTSDELKTIFTTFPFPWREMAMVSFYTGGQRIGDIATLKWENVDFEKGYINMWRKKQKSEAQIPMIPLLRDILLKLKVDGEIYVFPYAAQMKARSSSYLSTAFSNLLCLAGITAVEKEKTDGKRRVSQKCFHSLRHSAVSVIRSDPRFTADLSREVVGHASDAVERGYYTADDELKLQALQALADSVTQKKPGA